MVPRKNHWLSIPSTYESRELSARQNGNCCKQTLALLWCRCDWCKITVIFQICLHSHAIVDELVISFRFRCSNSVRLLLKDARKLDVEQINDLKFLKRLSQTHWIIVNNRFSIGHLDCSLVYLLTLTAPCNTFY